MMALFPMQKAREGDVDMIKAWCRRSNDVDELIQFDDWRPLQFAAAEGDEVAISTLLDAGANPKEISQSRIRPCHGILHIAARYGHVSVVERLLAAGADPNQFDSHGLTPLHYAAVQNHIMTSERLLQLGANPNLTNSPNRLSAIALARHCGNLSLVDLFEKLKSKNQDHSKLQQWLHDIGCHQYFDQIIDAGYDFDLIAEHGLSQEDVEAIGIPNHKKGHEKKLLMRHKFPFHLYNNQQNTLHSSPHSQDETSDDSQHISDDDASDSESEADDGNSTDEDDSNDDDSEEESHDESTTAS